jgi:hypothetical protein
VERNATLAPVTQALAQGSRRVRMEAIRVSPYEFPGHEDRTSV